MSDLDIRSEATEQWIFEGKALCEKYICKTIPPSEVAKFLGIGVETFRAAIQQNQFPFATPYKMGMSEQGRCFIFPHRLWSWIKCEL